MAPSVRYDPGQADRHDGLAFVASIGATAIVLGWIAGLPFGALRLPAGLFVGLFAPGYLLLRASVGPGLEGSLRFVLPVPLTLAMAAVFGVALDQTSDGLSGNALGVTLCACSLGLAVIAFIRGTHPLTFRTRDLRPSLLDVLRGPFRPPRGATGDLPPIAADLALSAAVLLALAVAGLWVSRSIDLSTDRTGSVALTGRVQTAAQPRDGIVRAGVELTVVNDRPGPITGILRIAVEPVKPGAHGYEQRLTVPASATSRVAVSLPVPCEGAVRATMTHTNGPRRAVRLRVRCVPDA
jgi:hypothetical protein